MVDEIHQIMTVFMTLSPQVHPSLYLFLDCFQSDHCRIPRCRRCSLLGFSFHSFVKNLSPRRQFSHDQIDMRECGKDDAFLTSPFPFSFSKTHAARQFLSVSVVKSNETFPQKGLEKSQLHRTHQTLVAACFPGHSQHSNPFSSSC